MTCCRTLAALPTCLLNVYVSWQKHERPHNLQEIRADGSRQVRVFGSRWIWGALSCSLVLVFLVWCCSWCFGFGYLWRIWAEFGVRAQRRGRVPLLSGSVLYLANRDG